LISKSDIKYIQSLAHKKFRDEERLFIVEGVKMVEELISSASDNIDRVFATKNWVERQLPNTVVNKLTVVIEEHELAKISQHKTPNEVLALVKFPKFQNEYNTDNKLTLVLDQIQDPGNLGTIIRTCDWFGINQIVCSLDTVDNYNPKVIQSAMGSILHVEVIYRSLPSFLSTVQDIPIYAAVLNGKSIHDIAIAKPSLLLIGNESNGISKEVLAFATEKITIPKLGQAESLNAAIASGIIISALLK
jgi:TrmH family RNA methyltransferase